MEKLKAQFNPRYTDDRYRYTLTHLKGKVSRELEKISVDHKTTVKRKQSVILQLETENECQSNDILSLNKEIIFLKDNVRFCQESSRQRKAEREDWRKKCESVTTDFTQVVNQLKRLGILSPKSLKELTTDGKKLRVSHTEMRLKSYTDEKMAIEMFLAKHKKECDGNTHAEVKDSIRNYEMNLELMNEQISVVREILNSKVSELNDEKERENFDSEFVRQRFGHKIDREFESLREKTLNMHELQTQKSASKTSDDEKNKIDYQKLIILETRKLELEQERALLRKTFDEDKRARDSKYVEAIETENQTLKCELAEVSKELEKTKQESKLLMEKVAKLETEIQRLEVSNKDLEKDKIEFEKTAKELQGLLKKERETTKLVIRETESINIDKGTEQQSVRLTKTKALLKINSKMSEKEPQVEQNDALVQRQRELETELARWRDSASTLEKEVHELKSKMTEIREEFQVETDRLGSLVKDKESELEKLINERQFQIDQAKELEKKLLNMDQNLETSETTNETLENQMEKLRSSGEESKVEVERLGVLLEERNSKLQKLNVELKSELDKTKELEKKVQTMEQNLEASTTTIETMTGQIQQLKLLELTSTELAEEKEQLLKERDELNELVKEKGDIIFSLNKTSNTLTLDNQKLKEERLKATALEQKMVEMTLAIETYEVDISTITESKQALANELLLFKNKANSYSQTVDDLNSYIGLLQKEKDDMANANEALKNATSDRDGSDTDELKSELVEWQQRAQALEEDVLDQKSKVTEILKQSKVEADRLITLIKNKERELEKLNNTLKLEIDKERELEKKIQSLEQNLETSATTVETLKNQTKKFKSSESKAMKLSEEKKQLLAKRDELNELMQQKDESIFNMTKKNKTLFLDNQKLREQSSKAAKLDKDIGDMTLAIEKSKLDMSTITKSKQALDKEVSSWKSKANSYRQTIDKLNADIELLHKEKVDLANTIELLQKSAGDLNNSDENEADKKLKTHIEEARKFKEKIKEQKDELSQLLESKKTLESQLQSAVTDASAKGQEAKNLREVSSKQKDEINRLTKNVTKLKNDLKLANESREPSVKAEDIAAMKEEINKLTRTVDELRKQKEIVESNLNQVKDKMENSGTTIQPGANSVVAESLSQEKLEEIEKQSKELKEQNLKLKLLYKTVKTKCDALTKVVSDQKTKDKTSEAKMNELTEEIARLQDTKVSIQKEKDELGKSIAQLKIEMADLRKEHSQQRQTIEKLEGELSQEKLLSDNKQLMAENARIKKELKNLGSGDGLKEKYSNLVEESQKRQREVDDLKKQLAENETRCKEMTTKVEKAKEMYQKHKETIRKQETQLAILTQEKQALEKKISIFKDKNSFIQQMQDLEEQKRKLTQEVAKCKAIINVMKVKSLTKPRVDDGAVDVRTKEAAHAAALLAKRKKSTAS